MGIHTDEVGDRQYTRRYRDTRNTDILMESSKTDRHRNTGKKMDIYKIQEEDSDRKTL